MIPLCLRQGLLILLDAVLEDVEITQKSLEETEVALRSSKNLLAEKEAEIAQKIAEQQLLVEGEKLREAELECQEDICQTLTANLADANASLVNLEEHIEKSKKQIIADLQLRDDALSRLASEVEDAGIAKVSLESFLSDKEKELVAVQKVLEQTTTERSKGYLFQLLNFNF